jgi:hypothetical protein
VFLLSPAQTGGERARLIHNRSAGFELARRLQRGETVPIGEVFSFLSGLYFRGKLAYARRFSPPRATVWVITSNLGLLSADRPIGLQELAAFGEIDVDAAEPRYRLPLEQDACGLKGQLGPKGTWVLLGSIGTRKYADPLLAIFGERLLFPAAFVGRGDMSRGGLLLRAVSDGKELEYVPLATAVRHGSRPPKLPPLRRRSSAILTGRWQAAGQNG